MRTILSLCFILFVSLASAQNKKGNYLLGVNAGNIDIGFTKSEDPNSSSTNGSYVNVTINPSAGYYFTERLVLGATVDLNPFFSKSKSKYFAYSNEDEVKTGGMSVSVGPFARYYFGQDNVKGMPFVQAGFGIDFYPAYKSTSKPVDADFSFESRYKEYDSWQASMHIGYEHYLNSILGLQYAIGYFHRSSHVHRETSRILENGTPTLNSVSENKSKSNIIQLSLGLTIHFNRNK